MQLKIKLYLVLQSYQNNVQLKCSLVFNFECLNIFTRDRICLWMRKCSDTKLLESRKVSLLIFLLNHVCNNLEEVEHASFLRNTLVWTYADEVVLLSNKICILKRIRWNLMLLHKLIVKASMIFFNTVIVWISSCLQKIVVFFYDVFVLV